MVAKTDGENSWEEVSACDCTLPPHPHRPHTTGGIVYVAASVRCPRWTFLLSRFQRDRALFFVGCPDGNKERAINSGVNTEEQIAVTIQARPSN